MAAKARSSMATGMGGGGRHGVRRKANGDQLSPLGGIGYWFSPELLEPNTEAFLMD